MSNFLISLIYLVAIIATAVIGGTTSQSAFTSGWYNSLNKPPLTPPNSVFPVVWAILYLLIFIAGSMTDKEMRESCDSQLTTFRIVFAIGLILNLAWSLFFFGQRNIGGALVVNFLLVMVNLYILTLIAKYSRTAYLFYLLYTLWTIYALYLTAGVWILN